VRYVIDFSRAVNSPPRPAAKAAAAIIKKTVA
jgi:hypothetical protein